MIYVPLGADDPIRQGDIFQSVPRVRVPLSHLAVLREDGTFEATWTQASGGEGVVRAVLPLEPVWAIVITQNCDATRNEEISLCEIKPFAEVEPRAAGGTIKARVAAITRQAKVNYKWFYLPPDPTLGLDQKMAVDFRCTMRLPRPELETHRHLRRGRLYDDAYDHFRERLAHFFRRYAYDEWYPLDREEMDFYADKCPEQVARYPWQREE
ncbi:hypothetical protein ACFL09_04525 [Planctomycetota bacterium]